MAVLTVLLRALVSRCCALLALAGVAACGGSDPLEVSGFVLPEGDIEAGKDVFVEHGCLRCHTVRDTEITSYEGERALEIPIGGPKPRMKHCGERLTAVVHPKHVITAEHRRLLEQQGQSGTVSPMPDFNEQLTVAELIDLVAFLHSRYSKLVPDYRGYRYY